MGRVLLITGAPGIGKTTLLMRALRGLEGSYIGFITEEVRRDRVRVGFDVRSLGFKYEVFPLARREASELKGDELKRMGRYLVDVESFNSFCGALRRELTSLQEPSLAIIDEIGPMEILVPEFERLVRWLLWSSPHHVLATVKERGRGLIDEVKRSFRVIRLNEGNRKEILKEVKRFIERVTR